MASKNTELKLEQLAYLKIRTLLKVPATNIHKDLLEVYNDEALPYSTLVDWARLFREGVESIEYEPGAGRPLSGASNSSALEISAFLEEDPQISLVQIANAVGVSTGTAHTIVRENLKLRKVCPGWVPHVLTQAQKARRVQCAQRFPSDFDRDDTRRLFEIVTGDETWVRDCEPLSKEANKAWIAKDQDPPMIPHMTSETPRLCTAYFSIHLAQCVRFVFQRIQL